MLLPEMWVLPIILASIPRSLSCIHVSRLLSSSGQDLCSQRKHVNISPPRCPSHHGSHLQCVFIQKAPGSQHAQTSWTENSTVYRRRVFGVPSGPENNTGFVMKIYLPSKLCSHKCTEYLLTHTVDGTAFSSLVVKKFTEARTLPVCLSENNSIAHSFSNFFHNLTGKSESKRTLPWQ